MKTFHASLYSITVHNVGIDYIYCWECPGWRKVLSWYRDVCHIRQFWRGLALGQFSGSVRQLRVPEQSTQLTVSSPATTTRLTSIKSPLLSFFSQPCRPSLPASSFWGPRCPPLADQQTCELVLRLLPCFGSYKTRSLTTSFVLLQQ